MPIIPTKLNLNIPFLQRLSLQNHSNHRSWELYADLLFYFLL